MSPVVDLLERLAVGRVRPDLAHQQDHRRRVLASDVDADGGVRRPGTARDDRHAGTAGQLARGLGHVSGATFLPADNEGQAIANVDEGVEDRQVALAGDAEEVRGVLGQQARDEDLAAGT